MNFTNTVLEKKDKCQTYYFTDLEATALSHAQLSDYLLYHEAENVHYFQIN